MSEFTTTPENVIRLTTQNIPYYLAEAVNTLRGNIQLSGFKLKVIAVVSSNPNEGKSTVSLQLANSIASLKKNGKKFALGSAIASGVCAIAILVMSLIPGVGTFNYTDEFKSSTTK